MKNKLLTFLLLLAAFPVLAQNRYTVKLVVTNSPVQGNSYTLNGSTRTFTTNPLAATDMLLTNDINSAASAVWNNAISDPFGTGINYTLNTNTVVFTGGSGVTFTTNGAVLPWAYICILTNAVGTNGFPVLVNSSGVITYPPSFATANGLQTGNSSNATVWSSNNVAVATNNAGDFSAAVGPLTLIATNTPGITHFIYGFNSNAVMNLPNATVGVATGATIAGTANLLSASGIAALTNIPLNGLNTNGATVGQITTYQGTSVTWSNPPSAQVNSNTGGGVTVWNNSIGGTNVYSTELSLNTADLTITKSGGANVFTLGPQVVLNGDNGRSLLNLTLNYGTLSIPFGSPAYIADSSDGYQLSLQFNPGFGQLVVSNMSGVTGIDFEGGLGLSIGHSPVITSGNAAGNGVLTVFNVQTYGAVANTNMDSTPGINAAISALAASPSSNVVRELYFPPGNYLRGSSTNTSENPLAFDLRGAAPVKVVLETGASIWTISTNQESYDGGYVGEPYGAVFCVSSNTEISGGALRGTGIMTNNLNVWAGAYRLDGPGGNIYVHDQLIQGFPGNPIFETFNTNNAPADNIYTGSNLRLSKLTVTGNGNTNRFVASSVNGIIELIQGGAVIDSCNISNNVGAGVGLYYNIGLNNLSHIQVLNSTLDDNWDGGFNVINRNSPGASNEVSSDWAFANDTFQNSGTFTNYTHESHVTILGGDPFAGIGQGALLPVHNVSVIGCHFTKGQAVGRGQDGGLDVEGRVLGLTVQGSTFEGFQYGLYINDTHSSNLTYGASIDGNTAINCTNGFQIWGHGSNMTFGANSAFGCGVGLNISGSTNLTLAGGSYANNGTGVLVAASANIWSYNTPMSLGLVIGSLVNMTPPNYYEVPTGGGIPDGDGGIVDSGLPGTCCEAWPYWDNSAASAGKGLDWVIPTSVSSLGTAITYYVTLYSTNNSTVPFVTRTSYVNAVYTGGSSQGYVSASNNPTNVTFSAGNSPQTSILTNTIYLPAAWIPTGGHVGLELITPSGAVFTNTVWLLGVQAIFGN